MDVRIESGTDDYVIKPFSVRQILSRVRALLELVRTRSAANEATARLAETRALLEAKNVRLREAYEELQAAQVQSGTVRLDGRVRTTSGWRRSRDQ